MMGLRVVRAFASWAYTEQAFPLEGQTEERRMAASESRCVVC